MGIGLEAGASWEIERLPFNAEPTEFTGVEGGIGYALTVEARYSIDALSLSFRPTFMLQETVIFRLPGDDSGMSFRQELYPSAILFPFRASLAFGQQRFQPILGIGGGFLIAIKEQGHSLDRPRPEPVLPYLEVAVGVRFSVGQIYLRPELSVRNGTGELFSEGRTLANRPFGGQRWGYAGIGVVIGK